MKTLIPSRTFRLLATIAVIAIIAVGGLAWYVHRERERAKLAQPLIDAFASDNAVRVRDLLRRGADPNLRVRDEVTLAPIHRDSLALVLWNVIRVHRPEARGIPLASAFGQFGQQQSVAALLDAGADPNGRNCSSSYPPYNRTTPLLIAAAFGRPIATAALLRHGADPDIQSTAAETPLHVAVTALARLHEIEDPPGPAPPYNPSAGFDGLAARCQYELDRSDRPSRRTEDMEAEMDAAYRSVVTQLIAAGADVNARDKKGRTPLDCIRDRKQNADLVTLLTRAGARE